MKCDRYIGTGATSSIQKDAKSVHSIASNASRTTIQSENKRLQSHRRSQVSLFEADHGNTSRRESLQVPALSSVPESPNSPSSIPSTVLIKEVVSNLNGDINRKDGLESNENHCIVIEMHKFNSNNAECNKTDNDHADVNHQLTTIREYEVTFISTYEIVLLILSNQSQFMIHKISDRISML